LAELVKLLFNKISYSMPRTPAWEADVLPLNYARSLLRLHDKFCSLRPGFTSSAKSFAGSAALALFPTPSQHRF
jgi:hypothetical protein